MNTTCQTCNEYQEIRIGKLMLTYTCLSLQLEQMTKNNMWHYPSIHLSSNVQFTHIFLPKIYFCYLVSTLWQKLICLISKKDKGRTSLPGGGISRIPLQRHQDTGNMPRYSEWQHNWMLSLWSGLRRSSISTMKYLSLITLVTVAGPITLVSGMRASNFIPTRKLWGFNSTWSYENENAKFFSKASCKCCQLKD